MTTAEVIAVTGIVAAALFQGGAMLYWGGQVRQMLRDHERRIVRLEDAE